MSFAELTDYCQTARKTRLPWDHCSGYHYPDTFILGFSHTHLQGTGAADLGDVLLMPVVEGRNWEWNTGEPGREAEAQIQAGGNSGWVFDEAELGYRSAFSHDREMALPGYYAVHLDTPDVQGRIDGHHALRHAPLPLSCATGLDEAWPDD
jgi:putative alpha-1,2-mannosidase